VDFVGILDAEETARAARLGAICTELEIVEARIIVLKSMGECLEVEKQKLMES
jgi:hypothetical protein